jgi:4-hydroxy-2-oxoheptanedioate aldolase
MRTSRVKTRLKADQPALITALQYSDPAIYEMVSLMGFDGIWLDLEHHHRSLETASQLMRAARVGTSDIIARPAKGQWMKMGRILEAGAQGIIYPRCDDADEAAQVVRWSKFAPLGQRGFDGSHPDVPFASLPVPQYVAQANEQTLIVIQIESPDALYQAGQIAAVQGVDVLMLGPADFGIASGIPGQWDHEVIDQAAAQLAAAARNAGKHWGSPCRDVEHARQLIDLGARFICYNSDFQLLKEGFEGIRKSFENLGFDFPQRL